ncbi:Dicer-like protein 2 [Penicillium diatomitis]|uniref:Dicer-like protein 2 n=1 Tax=Penicillium diatomitis TaxID=2819901 RepID=A0A9W9WLA1_9EURO|nr:Dicer-like protein 2 [Penicillium diatomitis]KAJ5469262.1 Dicer-like protein 2 [Penicillium diatomitis]
MDIMDESPDLSGPVSGTNATPAYRARGYQLEMLEASMKQNIIVAMDTGSGKTHIAVLRIIAELERCPTSQLVWFLAPTVSLCTQQHDVLASQIPSVKTRILTGDDHVERWTEQAVWNEVLRDVRIVCSTHAILSDALNHGFVRMSQLALLVFDEAHHCTRGHPANKIMRNHYHPTKARNGADAVPHILGLTASPIIRSKPQELTKIEANLDATCKTPHQNRLELQQHVHRPRLEQIVYSPLSPAEGTVGSQMIPWLVRCIQSYRREDDPSCQIHSHLELGTQDKPALAHQKVSYCREQLDKFLDRSLKIYSELGGWAADYYIRATLDQLQQALNKDRAMESQEHAEKVFLLEILLGQPIPGESDHISPKLETLLSFLDAIDDSEFSGIIFVKERVTVSVLWRFLSWHPATRDKFRSAPFVGWSNHAARKQSLGDLISRDMQRNTLAEFRAGRKNLLIGTDVLEEGLDISACRLVVCFDKPPNVKSFIQRRGRARHPHSVYALMLSTEDESLAVTQWQALETAMIEAYMQEYRLLEEDFAVEAIQEAVDDCLFVNSTCARISAEEAVPHLQHFCSVLPSDPYVENSPTFSYEEGDHGLLRGAVVLPNSVHPSVRQAHGKRWWRTEKAARKDAAFQAYKALWEYGLVNDNLLPLSNKAEIQITKDESLPAIVECSGQYDPLIDLAHAWAAQDLHMTSITVTDQKTGQVYEDLQMSMILPRAGPVPDPLTFFWESDTRLTVSFGESQPLPFPASAEMIKYMRDITAMYLQAPSSRLQGLDRDYVALFVPNIPVDQLGAWLQQYQGTQMATEMFARDPTICPVGIIRDTAKYSEPRLFRMWHDVNPVEVEVQSLPKRRNLLQYKDPSQMADEREEAPPKIHLIPAIGCTVDRLPWKKSMFGLFISAILDRVTAVMAAHKLNETILKGSQIRDLRHVLTAITTPLAQAPTHYQLYEFFGDAVLKFTASCQLFFSKPAWHEGYLSESRDKSVKNQRLARGALDVGLDQFILNDRFTPRRWHAPIISKKISPEAIPPKRKLAMNVLADVVEALIGAAYMDGGISKAQTCLYRFIPEIDLQSMSPQAVDTPPASRLVDTKMLSKLIGYEFTNAHLLTEALTHPSCEHDTKTQSYQRLEYLGDAVLDMVVVSLLANLNQQIPEGKMTLFKHSVVNAGLMAFLCMDLTVDGIYLWQFLRYNGPTIALAQAESVARYEELREVIWHELNHGSEYPWEIFSRLRPDKFMSDIIESVLGAIFLDTGADLSLRHCEAFLERLGLLPYLRRIISNNVDVQHPRSKAQDILAQAVGQVGFKARRVEAKGVPATYRCTATLNKTQIALIEGCASADEAEIKTALWLIENFQPSLPSEEVACA